MRITRCSKHGKERSLMELTAEDPDDIYALYSLVEEHDIVKSLTTRGVPGEEGKSKTRMSMVLEIEVKSTSVDLEAGILFVHGYILTDTKYAKMGSTHTIEVCCGHRFTLSKVSWTVLSEKTLKKLSKIENKADLMFVICREESYSVVLASPYLTRRIRTIRKEAKARGKKGQAPEKAIAEMAALITDSVKLCVVAGENAEAVQKQVQAKSSRLPSRMWATPVTSTPNTPRGDREAIDSIVNNPRTWKILEGVRYAKEILASREFFELEGSDPQMVCNGLQQVQAAVDSFLVKKLIVVDSTLKSTNPETRKQLADLSKDAERQGGAVFVLSENNFLGKGISDRGGVVAILSHPVDAEAM